MENITDFGSESPTHLKMQLRRCGAKCATSLQTKEYHDMQKSLMFKQFTDKPSVLATGRRILRSIHSQRTHGMRTGKGYTDTEWARRELKNIDFALSRISTSEDMAAYIRRNEITLMHLLPARNRKQRELLKEIINSNI